MELSCDGFGRAHTQVRPYGSAVGLGWTNPSDERSMELPRDGFVRAHTQVRPYGSAVGLGWAHT